MPFCACSLVHSFSQLCHTWTSFGAQFSTQDQAVAELFYSLCAESRSSNGYPAICSRYFVQDWADARMVRSQSIFQGRRSLTCFCRYPSNSMNRNVIALKQRMRQDPCSSQHMPPWIHAYLWRWGKAAWKSLPWKNPKGRGQGLSEACDTLSWCRRRFGLS